MEKKVFLATWKDIPAQNEVQFTIENVECNAGKGFFSEKCPVKKKKQNPYLISFLTHYRWRVDKNAPEQCFHGGKEDPRGAGHGVPVRKIHQQRLGTCGTQDPAWQSEHNGNKQPATQ